MFNAWTTRSLILFDPHALVSQRQSFFAIAFAFEHLPVINNFTLTSRM